MRSGKKNLKFENVLGNQGVFFFSRRAHLLTTSSAQSPFTSVSALRRKLRSLPCASSPHKIYDFAGPLSAVVFPLEIVRSPRGMRLLRKPYGQCHISVELLSLSTQLAIV